MTILINNFDFNSISVFDKDYHKVLTSVFGQFNSQEEIEIAIKPMLRPGTNIWLSTKDKAELAFHNFVRLESDRLHKITLAAAKKKQSAEKLAQMKELGLKSGDTVTRLVLSFGSAFEFTGVIKLRSGIPFVTFQEPVYVGGKYAKSVKWNKEWR